MPKKLFPLMVLLLLTACQQVPVQDENSPLMRIPTGSTITVKETLTVPAGHARVFLQNGKPVAKVRLKRYYPHCNFEVRQVSDGHFQIQPDTFLITDVAIAEEEWVSRQPLLRHAAWQVDGGDSDGPVLLTRLIHHRLYSPRQPQVMRLTCHGGFAEGWKVAYPSISDIRQALGGYVILNLPQGD